MFAGSDDARLEIRKQAQQKHPQDYLFLCVVELKIGRG